MVLKQHCRGDLPPLRRKEAHHCDAACAWELHAAAPITQFAASRPPGPVTATQRRGAWGVMGRSDASATAQPAFPLPGTAAAAATTASRLAGPVALNHVAAVMLT